MRTIGQTIKWARCKQGKGVRDFCKAIGGCAPSYLLAIERDERLPAKGLSTRIESELGVPGLVDRIRAAVIDRWERGKK